MQMSSHVNFAIAQNDEPATISPILVLGERNETML